MEYIQLTENRIQITAQGLADFCLAVAEKFDEGYKFNFQENETYPYSYGTFYHVVLEKPLKPEVPPATETPSARKTKAKE
jgi:hypothetical protein